MNNKRKKYPKSIRASFPWVGSAIVHGLPHGSSSDPSAPRSWARTWTRSAHHGSSLVYAWVVHDFGRSAQPGLNLPFPVHPNPPDLGL
ncbi:hypothetical protein V6N11_017470 [Hibiscus sabdariffa]|uniref:Uncharacterized protein n=1 Tax=Hibiscus sabdariffa TaxID=183260 RepID=A0ABR2TYG8_9ROSI